MRRTITIAVAIAMLVGAAAAYAALNTYTASFSFAGKAGTKAKPASIGYTERYAAANTVPGKRAAVLTKIVTKIYGLQGGTGKYFPVCKLSQIKAPNWDKACPKGSLVALGRVHSRLGDHSLAGAGAPCDPYLAVYNGGANVQTFFFYIKTNQDCLNLHTGASLPWQGTMKSQGGSLVETVNLPPDISTNAGGTGLYGSLIDEVLTYSKLNRKVKGKTYAYNASVGCKAGKRPWSISFTATDGTGAQETKTVSGSGKC